MRRPSVSIVGFILGALTLSACTNNPDLGSSSYKEGKLGNGSFLFKCDDSVACDRWSTNDAKDFPSQIALGSRFSLRFVADGEEGMSISIDGRRYDGITLEAIAPYVGSGPEGFTPLKAGYGTVVAREANGRIIDFVHLKLVQPDGLVVYKAEYKGTNPERLQALNMTIGQTQSFRTVAEYKQEAIAGAIPTSWESADPSIVQVASYTSGVVTIIGKSAGKTKLKVVGAALSKELDVEVAQ